MRENDRKSFDYTAMSTFLGCQRRYDLRINQGYVRKQVLLAPNFGGAIHKALDSWYEDKDIEKAVEVFNGEFQEDLERDDKRTNKMGKWILENYDKQYKDQPWELMICERAFDIDLPNGNKFTGRIDKIIKWGNCLWIVDHKTTSSLGASYFNMAEPNMQFPGYCWAARRQGYDVKGVIVDAILVAKGLLPGVGKNDRLTPLARYDLYYTPDALDEWLQTIMETQEAIKQAEEKDKWTPNFDACTHFGECQFRKVCKEGKELRQRVLEMDYEVDYWDPLEKGKE